MNAELAQNPRQHFAGRTNAWTDTDHTCYTVYTAGPSGFLHILPVYLDHILHPNLREEDYLTEVHHINGEGQDAGVVYSEMQVLRESGQIFVLEISAMKLRHQSLLPVWHLTESALKCRQNN